jgi:hypothetical protein
MLPESPRDQIRNLLAKTHTKLNKDIVPTRPPVINNTDSLLPDNTYVVDGRRFDNNFAQYYNTMRGIYNADNTTANTTTNTNINTSKTSNPSITEFNFFHGGGEANSNIPVDNKNEAGDNQPTNTKRHSLQSCPSYRSDDIGYEEEEAAFPALGPAG